MNGVYHCELSGEREEGKDRRQGEGKEDVARSWVQGREGREKMKPALSAALQFSGLVLQGLGDKTPPLHSPRYPITLPVYIFLNFTEAILKCFFFSSIFN